MTRGGLGDSACGPQAGASERGCAGPRAGPASKAARGRMRRKIRRIRKFRLGRGEKYDESEKSTPRLTSHAGKHLVRVNKRPGQKTGRFSMARRRPSHTGELFRLTVFFSTSSRRFSDKPYFSPPTQAAKDGRKQIDTQNEGGRINRPPSAHD